MSSSLALYAETGCIYSILYNAFRSLFKCLSDNYLYSGLVISDYGGKSFLVKHLEATDTIFINLDAECAAGLTGVGDSDNKTKLSNNLQFYREAKQVLDDVIEIHSKTSKSINKICFLTRDYRLLKFLGIPKISYLMGNQLYFDNLKLDAEKMKSVIEYRDTLLKNKGEKIITYSTQEALLDIVCELYQCKTKI